MPIIVHLSCEHVLGTEQLIPVSSFHGFSFKRLDMLRCCWCIWLSPFSCYLCAALFHIVEGIWMDSKKKKSYALF